MDPSVILGLMGSAICALFGLMVKTQNDRLTEKDRQNAKLTLDNQELAAELKVIALKVEEIIKTEQDATRQELAELRETNAALVVALSEKGAV